MKVIKHDLQLLAQISSSSEEGYFKAFMMNLLELFSTDRRLLEARGSLIIRQLCLSLNTERIYRTFAEILEKEEVSLVFRRHISDRAVNFFFFRIRRISILRVLWFSDLTSFW
jgi:Vacuolar protein 14 C-terminal Fig4p binding